MLPMVQPAHLDRTFDYRVPEALDDEARPGVRVRVRFSGRLIDGYVLERVADTEHQGRLGAIERVVSPLPVLTGELAALCEAVAQRYAGTRADVLRLAVPPRHARAESAALESLAKRAAARDGHTAGAEVGSGNGLESRKATDASGVSGDGVSGDEAAGDGAPADDAWDQYVHGAAFVDAARGGRAPRAVWQAMPGEDWAQRIAEAAHATFAGGRSAVIVVADRRDLDRVAAALRGLCAEDPLADGAVVELAGGLGPQARYRRWVTALAGPPCIVVGNRSAVFTPVARLGLVALWDDGDDLLSEPRSPYPHAREVGLLRADAAGAGFLLGGHARTAEAQSLVDHGWAQDLVAPRHRVRSASPLIRALADSEQALARDPAARQARLPAIGFQAARDALAAGLPVLVQVPRAGYIPVVACANCREPARCRRCAGPLGLPSPRTGAAAGAEGGGGDDQEAAAPPTCRWCGTPARSHSCTKCGSRALRAQVTGAQRTAEEFGRAFRGVPVIGSSGSEVRDEVPARAAVVVATVGAEPVAPGGYGAALLLDGWSLLTRADLRAGEEALRRWMAASALVRSAEAGGKVVVVADAGAEVVQALIRWDPVGQAQLELAGRREVRFPPAVRIAAVDGAPDTLSAFLDLVELPDGAEPLGPVPLPPGVRLPGGGGRDGAGRGSARDAPAEPPADAERMLLRVPRRDGAALSRALAVGQAAFSSHRVQGTVRVQIDPVRVG
ncbi:primosomal protein N' [Tomitella fengzijianii]|uniref:Probable replication restart protein PriA n=2 Tax=Tomitella fengzijianii TaxID=2597660 RepID=A0A516X800_9ACTN|nr:primosomal protein N' [Tomitella fengzijianii]